MHLIPSREESQREGVSPNCRLKNYHRMRYRLCLLWVKDGKEVLPEEEDSNICCGKVLPDMSIPLLDKYADPTSPTEEQIPPIFQRMIF